MGKHNQVGEKLLQKNKSIIKKVKTSLNFMITEHLFLSQNNVNNDTMEQSLSIFTEHFHLLESLKYHINYLNHKPYS